MNELIKELADQAVNDIPDNVDFDIPDVFKQKFAELIVKECIEQCAKVREDAYIQKKSEFLTAAGKMLYEGVYGGANNCGFAIQQHFGVENE